MALDDNPFQAPPSGDGNRPPPDPALDSALEAPVRPLAVLVGAAVDTFATLVFQFVYVTIMVVRLGDSSGFERELEHTLRSLPHQLTLYVAGGAMSILGGLVAGVIARRKEVWHAIAAGVLSVGFGKLLSEPTSAAAGSGAEVWMAALATPLTIASAGLGGLLAARRRALGNPG